MISYTQATTESDLRQILELQHSNLKINISEDDAIREGFVTVEHSLELLSAMNDLQPHIVAKEKDTIVGYALCMHPKFGNDIDILKPMFKEISKCYQSSYIVMGQICIAKNYRGQGIFKKLYQTMNVETQGEFSSIITEVDLQNKRSLNAHYGLGFKDLGTYRSSGQDWKLIIW